MLLQVVHINRFFCFIVTVCYDISFHYSGIEFIFFTLASINWWALNVRDINTIDFPCEKGVTTCYLWQLLVKRGPVVP
jgi:hypothetical protein